MRVAIRFNGRLKGRIERRMGDVSIERKPASRRGRSQRFIDKDGGDDAIMDDDFDAKRDLLSPLSISISISISVPIPIGFIPS